jgi:hypothetical protein
MSTVEIVLIVLAVPLMAVALSTAMPQMRQRSQDRGYERQLRLRRKAAAATHRRIAEARAREAATADRRARLAQRIANRALADAHSHEKLAARHDHGLADSEFEVATR